MPSPSMHEPNEQRLQGSAPDGGGLRFAAASTAGEPPLDPGDDAPAGTPGTGENLCPRCNGSGRDGDRECSECGGSGKVITGIGGG